MVGHRGVAGWSKSQCGVVSKRHRRRQHSLLLTKLDWRVFGHFLVGGIGSVCGVTGSVTAWQQSSALTAIRLEKVRFGWLGFTVSYVCKDLDE